MCAAPDASGAALPFCLVFATIRAMKRVLIFALTYHPYVGGAEVAIKEITDRLNPDEYEFHMITLRFNRALPKVEKVGNITLHRIGFSVHEPRVSDRNLAWLLRLSKALFPFTAFWKGLRLDQKIVFDMTWAMMANQAGFAALFFKYFRRKTPYFLELQDGRALSQMRSRRRALMLLWPLYRSVFRRADLIKAISHFIEREALATGFKRTIEVIPNAVDVERFSEPAPREQLEELAGKLKKRDGDIVLFTASRLVLSRGVEDTIRALSYLPQNVRLLIAGDGEDLLKLQAIAREALVHERVIFAGHIPHELLPAYYQLSDIFVRPSVIEGFGNSFVEAFAAKLPVVATPVGGIPDFLFDPENNPDVEPTGLFCKVHDPESVARAVERYLKEPSLRKRIVENAAKLVRDKYDWNVVTQDVRERIFEKLIRRG